VTGRRCWAGPDTCVGLSRSAGGASVGSNGAPTASTGYATSRTDRRDQYRSSLQTRLGGGILPVVDEAVASPWRSADWSTGSWTRKPDARVVVAGDFNAAPDEVPVRCIRGDVENTGNPDLTGRVLVPAPARYTLVHQGRGEMLDHMLITRNLLAYYRGSEIYNEVLHDESDALAIRPEVPRIRPRARRRDRRLPPPDGAGRGRVDFALTRARPPCRVALDYRHSDTMTPRCGLQKCYGPTPSTMPNGTPIRNLMSGTANIMTSRHQNKCPLPMQVRHVPST